MQKWQTFGLGSLAAVVVLTTACVDDSNVVSSEANETGGQGGNDFPGSGGAASGTGGALTGGQGGSVTGGSVSTGGDATGGTSPGGNPSSGGTAGSGGAPSTGGVTGSGGQGGTGGSVSDAETRCLELGGTVLTAMCCQAVGDFPNLCLTGPCGCAPEYSHEVKICSCPDNGCFNGEYCL